MVAHWESTGLRVTTASSDGSKHFPDQVIIDGLTRSPRMANRRVPHALRQWVDRQSVDVILTNTATASALARLARTRVPVVYFCHGLHWNQFSLKSLPFRFMERLLLARTDGVVCMNTPDEIWFEKHAPQLPRLRLRHGVGLDTKRFPRNVERKPWTTGETLQLVWCGELTERKNPIDAIALVTELKRRGVDVELRMLGRGAMLSELEERIGDDRQVQLLGHVDPVPHFMLSHLLVQTSRWEGLPRVALEAVAMGMPTVGFDVKGVQDIPGAYLATEGDIEQLASQVLRAAAEGPRSLPELDALSYTHAAEAIREFLEALLSGSYPHGATLVR
ncbi:glycosyltransferase [Agrococcus beijingensis]|uniref:glycosyltransferase n=1 Tax=Agrococcus beijingensis TaxID=3068634 RepID=UPI0027406989|nr:glycosyltransferase [Agrococcus sp. REN33]